jgi:succinate dehydrogenase / fumarate reductase membrane anchor subunit
MVKSVLGVARTGLRDWMWQRLSAIVMTIYFVGLIGYLISQPDLSFAEWHHLFSLVWVKIATMVFLSCLLFHAWIGIWTIFTDYVKSYVIRCLLNFFVLCMLSACFFWGLMILWSV